MQVIVLAAGQSSRFYPFSNGIQKTMNYLLGRPILAHTIEGIRRGGINRIAMIVRGDGLVKRYFGDGRKFGVTITYVVQKEPLGMGDALLKAKDYLEDEFILIGGNHVNSEILIREMMGKKKKKVKGVVMVKKRANTWEYGVIGLRGDSVFCVVEKPKRGSEPSNYCLVSIYYLTVDFISILEGIDKHHYNFEEALDILAKKKKVQAVITEEEIATLKYPWDLFSVKNQLFKEIKSRVGQNIKIAKTAEIIGEVIVGDGATIMEGVRIKGPCYIGKNVVIGNNALLRDGTDIEDRCLVGSYLEVKNSLAMKGSTMHSGFIGDSIIGENCKIGAQFCTANVRLDRKTVKTTIKNEKVETGLKYLGVMMGKNVRVGIKSSTMPGIIIGQGAVIGPGTTVLHNVPADTRYYTKFQEIIEEKND